VQFESLKILCDLAETESFTKAAKINNVTQSAVSQTISALEKHFKSLLIERSKKNFRLTPEGGIVYKFSKEILQTFDSLQSKVQGIQRVFLGTIRVSTVYSIGLHELPPCLKQFLREHPQVNVHVEYRRANQVYDDVLGNRSHFGLIAYPSRDAKLEVVPLRNDSLVLVCHPQHPLAKQKMVKLQALDGQKFVNFEKDIPTRKAIDKIFKERGVAVNTVVEFDNVESVKGAVEIDYGVAILPEDTVRQEVANKTLVAVKLDGSYERQRGLIYKKGTVLSPAMKEFIEVLKKLV
jgi:LysR family transcriptional regulator, transcriptional activator of the cysJI operon